jgi:hypothetical protein
MKTLNSLVLALVLALTTVSAQAANYLAYRLDDRSVTEGEWNQVLIQAENLGITLLRSPEIYQNRILAFEESQASSEQTWLTTLSRMTPLPVNEFRGVFSVSTGRFYLRFKAEVFGIEAKSRLEASGFTVLTPESDLAAEALIVVEGTRSPANEASELAVLQQLPDLLFVAVNRVPLLVDVRVR